MTANSLSNWSRVCRDKKRLVRSRTAPPEFSSRETCCPTSHKLGASGRLGDVKSSKARLQDHQSQRLCEWPLARSTHCATSTQYPRACSTRETTGSVSTHRRSQIWRATAKASMSGEVVNLLVEKIASDRNPSVTMMNLVEELLAPDDIPAYLGSCWTRCRPRGTRAYP